MTQADIDWWAAAVTIVGGGIALVALWLSWWQLRLSRKSTAVAAVMAVHDSITQGWNAWLTAPIQSDKDFAFGNLVNVLETSCLAYREDMFVGRSKSMLQHYLSANMDTIDKAGLASQLLPLFQSAKTFENLEWFYKNKRV
ncbi:hypothetical protein ACLI1C_15420 [Devosia sp. XGJD_8]|uniref:hypothetical protein n=1 Tax=Devosia sp. XGJD_8 TaxID=3391187 RepID=UPI00398501AE